MFRFKHRCWDIWPHESAAVWISFLGFGWFTPGCWREVSKYLIIYLIIFMNFIMITYYSYLNQKFMSWIVFNLKLSEKFERKTVKTQVSLSPVDNKNLLPYKSVNRVNFLYDPKIDSGAKYRTILYKEHYLYKLKIMRNSDQWLKTYKFRNWSVKILIWKHFCAIYWIYL